jgi:hypothetical protein
MKSLILLLAVALLFQANVQAQASNTSDEGTILISTARFERAEKIQDIVPQLRGIEVESFDLSVKEPGTTQLIEYNVKGSTFHQDIKTRLASLPAGSELWVDNIVYKTPQPSLKQFYALKVRE